MVIRKIKFSLTIFYCDGGEQRRYVYTKANFNKTKDLMVRFDLDYFIIWMMK